MDYKDYYKILGVDRKASAGEIKRVYRKMALKLHPDRNPNDMRAEDKLKEINEAYQVLSDSDRRLRYDQINESYTRWQQSRGSKAGFNWDKWTTTTAARSGDVKQSSHIGIFDGINLGDFSEFFRRIFGGMPASPQGSIRRDQVSAAKNPYEYTVSISLVQAYQGANRKFEVDGRRLQVKIPPGARSGTRVRVAEAVVTPAGEKRDLVLVIRVLEDPNFRRKGNDLYSEASVDLYTAVLGGETQVRTLGGDVMLTIPPGTQPGKLFRLAGKGMPQVKNPELRGDQLV
jgi:curved DNA-binding protein